MYSSSAELLSEVLCYYSEIKSPGESDEKDNIVIQSIAAGTEYLSAEGKPIGVVRLAGPAMKLEDHGIPLSHHQGEGVIKTAPGKHHPGPPPEPLSPKDHEVIMSSAVLQDLRNMRPHQLDYNPYAPPVTGVYGMSYDPTGYNFAGLGPAQVQSHLLPAGPAMPGYPSMVLAPGQDAYYPRPGDYYPGTVRPLQPVYATESTEELIERMNRAQPTVSVYKPVQVDMPSPVDSGIGGELIVTPNKDNNGEVRYPSSFFLCMVWNVWYGIYSIRPTRICLCRCMDEV